MANKNPGENMKYSKILGKVEATFATVAGVLVLLLMIVTDANIIGRYFLRIPLTGSVEVAILLFVIIMVIPQAYVQQLKGHLGVEFIYERVSPIKRCLMSLFTSILLLLISVILTWQSVRFAARIWGSYFYGLIPIPYWPALLAVGLGFGLFSLRVLQQNIELFLEFRKLKGASKK